MNDTYPFVNTPLPYPYSALEPYIDTETMRLHHDAHLGKYISDLNEVLAKYPALQNMSLEELLSLPGCRAYPQARFRPRIILPPADALKLCRGAGGVFNHRLFFESMAPGAKRQPRGNLAAAINRAFGGYEEFTKKFTDAAMSVFGSGYAWLAVRNGAPVILTSKNQEVVPLCPILNLDVWEHAYYLKYHNLRAAYISAWLNIVNWPAAEARFQSCLGDR